MRQLAAGSAQRPAPASTRSRRKRRRSGHRGAHADEVCSFGVRLAIVKVCPTSRPADGSASSRQVGARLQICATPHPSGPVAQLAEQQTLNLLVLGSTPSGLTIRLTFTSLREPKARSWQATLDTHLLLARPLEGSLASSRFALD